MPLHVAPDLLGEVSKYRPHSQSVRPEGLLRRLHKSMLHCGVIDAHGGRGCGDDEVDRWPERFDQVVDQIERVGPTPMEEAKTGCESGGSDGSDAMAAQNGVGVIKKRVALLLGMSRSSWNLDGVGSCRAVRIGLW